MAMTGNKLYLKLVDRLIDDKQKPDATLLDVGCGNGNNVQSLRESGYDCFGCDVEFKEGAFVADLIASHHIEKISTSSGERDGIGSQDVMYHWPFQGKQFDYVISRAVLEHVFNMDDFASENNLKLKAGGVAIHYFPSKTALIEPHCGVPFAGVFQVKWYMILCCYLGLCFKRYRGKGDAAHRDLMRSTFHKDARHIRETFEKHNLVYQGAATKILMEIGLPRRLRFLARFALMVKLFELLRSYVMVFKKGEDKSHG